jgi:hypothetical protein
MALKLTPKALSLSNPPHRHGIWVPAFAGMSGFWRSKKKAADPKISGPKMIE